MMICMLYKIDRQKSLNFYLEGEVFMLYNNSHKNRNSGKSMKIWQFSFESKSKNNQKNETEMIRDDRDNARII